MNMKWKIRNNTHTLELRFIFVGFEDGHDTNDIVCLVLIVVCFNY